MGALFAEGCWPGVARHATHFSLLRQRKVSKRKATLVPASLRFAAGNLRCSVQPGSKTTRFAQTSFCPDPSGPPLLGASTRGWGRNTKQPNPNTEYLKKQGLATASPCWYWGLVFVPASDWPLWMRRGAEVQADQGSRCLSEASLARPRLNRAPQVAPERSAGTQEPGSPFLW